jgi:hypothetical protein
MFIYIFIFIKSRYRNVFVKLNSNIKSSKDVKVKIEKSSLQVSVKDESSINFLTQSIQPM